MAHKMNKGAMNRHKHYALGTDIVVHRIKYKPAEGKWRKAWQDEEGNYYDIVEKR